MNEFTVRDLDAKIGALEVLERKIKEAKAIMKQKPVEAMCRLENASYQGDGTPMTPIDLAAELLRWASRTLDMHYAQKVRLEKEDQET